MCLMPGLWREVMMRDSRGKSVTNKGLEWL